MLSQQRGCGRSGRILEIFGRLEPMGFVDDPSRRASTVPGRITHVGAVLQPALEGWECPQVVGKNKPHPQPPSGLLWHLFTGASLADPSPVSCLRPHLPTPEMVSGLHLSPCVVSTSPPGQGAWGRAWQGMQRAAPMSVHSYGDLTSLTPHKRLPELPVVPCEKPHTGTAAPEKPRDSPDIAR